MENIKKVYSKLLRSIAIPKNNVHKFNVFATIYDEDKQNEIKLYYITAQSHESLNTKIAKKGNNQSLISHIVEESVKKTFNNQTPGLSTGGSMPSSYEKKIFQNKIIIL